MADQMRAEFMLESLSMVKNEPLYRGELKDINGPFSSSSSYFVSL